VTPSYDGNGNLTFDGTFTYCYDAENRMTAVLSAGTCAAPTTTVATYAYDAQRRRKSKTVGGVTTMFVTDADNREVMEYDGSSGAVQNWYAYGLGPNAVLNQMGVATAARTTFVPDILGSTIGSLDAASGTLTKVAYGVYGEGATSGSFRYTGQRIDPETNGLYYYRARHYMPAWGRFMQVDPVGYTNGSNLFAYVGNDPLNMLDPFGTTADTPETSGGNGGVGYWNAQMAAFGLAATTMSNAGKAAGIVEAVGLGPEDVPADVIAGGILVGGVAIATAQIAKPAMDKVGDYISGIVARATPGPDQYQYALIANSSGLRPDAWGAPVNLNAGDVYKYGTTVDPAGRYSNSYLGALDVTMEKQAFGSMTFVLIQEKLRLLSYFTVYGQLPPGNKIWR
jgi:RHS repeat-associated protein